MAGKGLYSIVATDASVGTTIGGFDAIDTRNGNVRLRDGAEHIPGLTFAGARADQTTATAVMGRLRISINDQGVNNEDFAVGSVNGGGIATQSGGYGAGVEFIPVDWKGGGGNVVNFFFSQMGIEPADNWSVVAGCTHSAGVRPPAPWYAAAMSGGTLPMQGSVSSNGAGVSAVTRTTLVSNTIAARFGEIVALRAMQAEDGIPATTEEAVGFIEVTSTIGDSQPQEWPVNAIGAALAGTLAGAGITDFVPWMPFYLQKAAQTETVEPFLTLSTAITAANAFGWSVGVRYGGGNR